MNFHEKKKWNQTCSFHMQTQIYRIFQFEGSIIGDNWKWKPFATIIIHDIWIFINSGTLETFWSSRKNESESSGNQETINFGMNYTVSWILHSFQSYGQVHGDFKVKRLYSEFSILMIFFLAGNVLKCFHSESSKQKKLGILI